MKPIFEYHLSIDGMMCGMCEAHVNNIILKNFPQVKKVKSSARKNLTKVISIVPLDLNELKKKVDETGYILKKIETIK